jgi:hypothetical protein
MFTNVAIKTITAFVAAAALAAPAAAIAVPIDLRSPDARDAALATVASQDLRSPDARDAARSDEITPLARPSGVRVGRAEAPTTDFAWGDAGIGAATVLALVGVAIGSGLLVVRHRRRHRPAGIG